MENLKQAVGVSPVSQGIEQIKSLFQGVREVIYLDVPNHFNIGDLLIFLGTLKFLELQGIKCTRIHNWGTFTDRVIDEAPEDALIILHGGGNFGDIYDTFQDFREYVVKRWPGRRIVVMPQSVHFAKADNLAKTSAIFRNHRDVVMLCRDEESFKIAKEHLTEQAYLVPDMAHFLEPELKMARPPQSGDTLVFRRRDVETTMPNGPRAFDWGDILHWPAKPLLKAVRILQRLEKRRLLPAGTSAAALIRVHKFVVRRGIDHFARFGVVDTDRMHAMLLARMMGLKVIAHDNSYGKLRRYGAVWLKGDDDVVWATPSGQSV